MAYNRLLSALSPELYEKLMPYLTLIELKQGSILHSPGNTIQHLYFPVNCVLSITITMEDGRTAETGLVGNREVLGLNALMGFEETTQTEYVVQIAGQAWKADATPFRDAFDQSPEVRRMFLGAIQAFIAQLSQTTACNRLHVLDQRLARWILEAQERVGSDHIFLTHAFMAEMLGVRRAGVTQAAQRLQDNNIISYNRGHVQILNRSALEASACECVGILRQEYDRLLGYKSQRDYIR